MFIKEILHFFFFLISSSSSSSLLWHHRLGHPSFLKFRKFCGENGGEVEAREVVAFDGKYEVSSRNMTWIKMT